MKTLQNILTLLTFGTAALQTGNIIAQTEAETDETSKATLIVGDTGNERENKIITALNAPADFDYFETSMGNVTNDLMTKYRIPIVLDDSAADNNLDADSMITVTLNGITFRRAIRIMLQPFQCTFVVKDEVLYIVSQGAAVATPVIRFFDCRDLVQTMDGDDNMNFDKLMTGMTTIIDPDSWSVNGGPGAVAEVGGLLFITQHQENQDRVEHYLNTLNQKFADQ